MIIHYHAGAVVDLLDLAEWYDSQRAGLGNEFRDDLDALAGRLAVHPRLYARVSPSPRAREIREASLARFPIRVTYEVTPAVALILSVTHSRSRRQPWRRRL